MLVRMSDALLMDRHPPTSVAALHAAFRPGPETFLYERPL